MTVLPLLVDNAERNVLVRWTGGKDQEASIRVVLCPDELVRRCFRLVAATARIDVSLQLRQEVRILT